MRTVKEIQLEQTLQMHLEEDEKLIKLSTITFNSFWNVLIGLQTYGLTIMMTYILAYNHVPHTLMVIVFTCDLFYLCDFIAAIVYVKNSKTLRFLPYRPKNWKVFLLDFFSLLPLGYAYEKYVSSNTMNSLLFRILLQNRCVRIYRIFILFSFYDLTIRHIYQYLLLMAIKFIAISFLISHTLSCVWYNIPNAIACTEGNYECLIWREVKVYRAFIHHDLGDKAVYHIPERILHMVVIILGFCVIYGDFIPHLLLIFLRVSRTQGRFFQKYLKLGRFLRNVGVDQLLNEKIEKYFAHFRISGTSGQELNKLIVDLPLALKKEIFTDIYWDAFRHSHIFRDVSRCCKRSLSLVMTTENFQEGDIFWSQKSFKHKMIYLVHGVIELMAAENDNSPIMSFSSGTVLGEMSLFWVQKSHAIIKCKTVCEVHTLSLRNTHRILLRYPKDKNIMFQKFNKRLAVAKITQWRKRRMMIQKMTEFDFSDQQANHTHGHQDQVKWVKMQWRAIWEMHERELIVIRAKEAGLRIPSWRKQHDVKIRLDAISNCMDLMVLSDVFEEKKDAVCLKTSFPWAIDPRAEFLHAWKIIVVIAAIIASVTAPLCCGWLDEPPMLFSLMSITYTIIFQIDLALLLMTAVKTKHGIITNFTSILMNCVTKPTFYLDCIAAVPFRMYNPVHMSSSWYGFLILPSCLKAHVFLKPKTPIGELMVFKSVVQNTFFFFLLNYWLAATIQLMSVRCFPVCAFFEWDPVVLDYLTDFAKRNLLSVILSLSTALGVTDNVTVKNYIYMIVITVTHLVFCFWLCIFLGDFYTVYSIKIANQLRFALLYRQIVQYLQDVQIQPGVEQRILRIVRFQWLYNKADDLLTRTSAIALAPRRLRQEIYSNSIYETLRKTRLFRHETSDFIYDNIDQCQIIAVPSGTVLVKYGMKSSRLHVIHKGYCQANSFLTKDITGGLCAPVLLKPGDSFPPITALASVPAPITVLTLTDCVIIVFQLEDVLKLMILHDIMRDLVSILKTSNYTEKMTHHSFAMIPMNVRFNSPADKKEEYDQPFQRYGCLGFILKHILFLKTELFFDENQQQKALYKFICLAYISYLGFAAFLWPLSFGLLLHQNKVMIAVFVATRFFLVFYVYLQFHAPYFDERGLLIKHPLYTMRHYLDTNFLLDLFMSLPLYSIYFVTYYNPGDMPHKPMVALDMTQKLLGLIYINGYFSNINKHSASTPLNRNVYALLILFALLNAIANFDMFSNVIYVFDDDGFVVGFTPIDHPGMSNCRRTDTTDTNQYFIMITFWLFTHLTSNNTLCITHSWQEKLYALFCSLIGTLVIWIYYGWMASHSAVSDALGTIYQERMKSFVEYLVSSKTEDKIVERSTGYFEHLWSRSMGQNIREIHERLPQHLHEELVHPLYRPTLNKVGIFEDVDESFFAMLSVNLTLVYFNRGSIILSRGQVQSDIFFVHRGKCFVFDWFLTLDIGSMIGDLSHTGHVTNKVLALTHVELLRINSDLFFSIINNYYTIEKRFLAKALKSENFIKSQYVQLSNQIRPVDSRDVLNAFDMQSKDFSFEDQSYFEDPENIMTQKAIARKQTTRLHKRFTFTIYPGTFPMYVYNIINFTVAFITVITTPNLLFFGGLTWPAFLVIGLLDGIWALGVLTSFRVGIEDKVKGAVITEGKFIAKIYLLSWDGFFLRLFSCLPFEFVPILTSNRLEDVDPVLIAGLRSFRFIRVYYLIKYLHAEVNKLKVSSTTRYMTIIIFYILFIHFMHLLCLLTGSNNEVISKMNPFEFGNEQIWAILFVYHYTLNIATSANLTTFPPETLLEMLCFNFLTILSIIAHGIVIKNVLSIKYIHNLARDKHKNEVSLLEQYLKKHDLSPSILKEVLDYKEKLLIVARSENNPTFLLAAPTSLRLAIMSDLYLPRLRKSPVFSGVKSYFLRLLVCRLKRQIFFPGQKIVEKGDVDNTMYFIHKGEVYVLDQTNDEAYVEFVVDRMFEGDEFGQAQGLSFATPHAKTYRARTIVEILILHSADWYDLKVIFPDIYMQLIERTQTFI